MSEPLKWDSPTITSFESLSSPFVPPHLGLPDYSLPFFLFVHKREENAIGVLSQKHNGNQRLIRYFPLTRHPTAQVFPPCLLAVVATAQLVQTTADLVLGHTLNILCPLCSLDPSPN